MPKKKEPDLKPEEQFKRFLKTAKEHGLEQTGKDLDEAFKKITTPAHKPTSSKEG